MRYVFVSDIHGRMDRLKVALESVGFDMQKDTLVSLGDPFDRGKENIEVLKFLMSCPHRVIVWGNHDLRLYDLLRGKDFISSYDRDNGTLATFREFTGDYTLVAQTNRNMKPVNFYKKDIEVLWHQYCKEAVFGLEFSDLIAVHAWVPCSVWDKYRILLMEDWRNATWSDWEEATWAHVENIIMCEAFPDKRMIIGHWHAWRLAIKFGLEERKFVPQGSTHVYIKTDPFYLNDQLIAIDGCSNYEYGGQVNAWVYESDEDPIFFSPKE